MDRIDLTGVTIWKGGNIAIIVQLYLNEDRSFTSISRNEME
jgi:hypothetical protein